MEPIDRYRVRPFTTRQLAERWSMERREVVEWIEQTLTEGPDWYWTSGGPGKGIRKIRVSAVRRFEKAQREEDQ